jgi:Flp pilus assembly pilin Flp
MFQIAAFLQTHIRGSLRGIGARFAGERGQDLIEYALLSGLIAAALAVIFATGLNTAIGSLVDGISACVDFAPSTPCAAG